MKMNFLLSCAAFLCLVSSVLSQWGCQDRAWDCTQRQQRGECSRNRWYMERNCKRTCNLCGGGGGGGVPNFQNCYCSDSNEVKQRANPGQTYCDEVCGGQRICRRYSGGGGWGRKKRQAAMPTAARPVDTVSGNCHCGCRFGTKRQSSSWEARCVNVNSISCGGGWGG